MNSPKLVLSHPLSLNQNFKKQNGEKRIIVTDNDSNMFVKEKKSSVTPKVNPFPSFASGSQNPVQNGQKEEKKSERGAEETTNSDVSSMKVSFIRDQNGQLTQAQGSQSTASNNLKSSTSPVNSFIYKKSGNTFISSIKPENKKVNDAPSNLSSEPASDTTSNLAYMPQSQYAPSTSTNPSSFLTPKPSLSSKSEMPKSASPARRKNFVKGCLKKTRSSVFNSNRATKCQKKVTFNSFVETNDKEKFKLNDLNPKKQEVHQVQYQPMYPVRDFSKPIPRAGVKIKTEPPQAQEEEKKDITPPRPKKPIKRVAVVQSPVNMVEYKQAAREQPTPQHQTYTIRESWKDPTKAKKKDKRDPTPGKVLMKKKENSQRRIPKVTVVQKGDPGAQYQKNPEPMKSSVIIQRDRVEQPTGNSLPSTQEALAIKKYDEKRRSIPSVKAVSQAHTTQRIKSPMRKFDKLLMKASYLKKKKEEVVEPVAPVVQHVPQNNVVMQVVEKEPSNNMRTGSFLKQRLVSPERFKKNPADEKTHSRKKKVKKSKKKKEVKMTRNSNLSKVLDNIFRCFISFGKIEAYSTRTTTSSSSETTNRRKSQKK